MQQTIRVASTNFNDVARALKAVADETRMKILVRALNRTGDQTFTQIKRTLSKQTGLRAGRVARVLSKHKGNSAKLEYTITARDKWTRITAGNFGARQTRKGVSHRAWGGLKKAAGAFMHRTAAVARKTRDRLPLKSLFGPNVAREMERGDERRGLSSYRDATDKVQQVFIPRVMHELDRELKKAKGRYGL